jgi:outer membrane protein OmpA-like peptidoglycan-associated protein
MTASGYAHGSESTAVHLSSSARFVLAAACLCLGMGALAVMDWVLLPRYLALRSPSVTPRPTLLVAPPAAPAAVPVVAPSVAPAPPVAAPEPVVAAVAPPAEEPKAVEQAAMEKPTAENSETQSAALLLFANNTAWLSPESKATLAQLADLLEAHPERHVVLNGHTDDSGTLDHNRALAVERARRAGRWLEARGVDPSRITTHGFASTQPLTDDPSPKARARNRRVEIEVR